MLARITWQAQGVIKIKFFAINILSENQKEISRKFATKNGDKVSSTPHKISVNGNIILDDIVGHIELSVFQQIDIADHVLVIGKVENLNIDEDKKPLIYYRSEYQDLK